MPFVWNNMAVVTVDELVPEYWPSWDALRRKLDRDRNNPLGIKRAKQGKGKGNKVLILYDTLPEEIRSALRDPRKVDCVLENYFFEDNAATKYFGSLKASKNGYLKPEQQAQFALDACVLDALKRLEVAHREECLKFGKKNCLTKKAVEEYLADAAQNLNMFRQMRKQPLHKLPVNPRRLTDKRQAYEDYGYDCFLSKFKNSNASKKTENIKSLLRAMFCDKQKPTPTEVAKLYLAFLNGEVDVINPDTGEIYDPKDFKELSPRTITSFLTEWKERVVTHQVRMADRQKYMQQYDPWSTLEQPEYAGSIISIDDRQPPFEYDKGKRAWFYNAIDLGSECIIATVWGKDKDGLINRFYEELTRNIAEWGLNMPYELECESSLNSQYKDTLLKPGNMFQEVRIIPNKARSKRIERYFRELRYDYEKKRSGWIGRPFARDESNQTDPNNKKIIPYDTIIRNCLEDIAEWNNSPHSKYTNKTRWEVWMEKQHEQLEPINWHGILPYIGERTNSSCNVGFIKLNKKLFLLGDKDAAFSGDDLVDAMDLLEGKDVEMHWLKGHNGSVLKAHVYRNERCVCEGIPKPIAKRSRLEAKADENHKQASEVMARYIASINTYRKNKKAEIEDLVVIDKRKRTLNDGFDLSFMGIGTGKNTKIPIDDDFEEENLEDDPDLKELSNAFKEDSKTRTRYDRYYRK